MTDLERDYLKHLNRLRAYHYEMGNMDLVYKISNEAKELFERSIR